MILKRLKIFLLFYPLLILGQMDAGVNTLLLLYLTRDMSCKKKHFDRQSVGELKTHKQLLIYMWQSVHSE